MTSISTQNAPAVRKVVADAYTQALSQPAGCCSPESEADHGAVAPAALAIGYQAEDLAALPSDAVTNSFGCGNPLAFSGIQPGDVVVDLGSGAGIDVLLAGRKVGPTGRVIGVDMTEAMLERARANIAASGLSHLEVRQGLIEALPVDSASVDWVISNCVINLSPEKDRVFTEVARVLKPGGRLLISDIVAEGMPDWLRADPGLYTSCLGGAIAERDYIAGLQRAGLVDVQVVERLVYDETQIRDFLESEKASLEATLVPVLGPDWRTAVERLTALALGKVWSARFAGRKA